MKTRMMMTCSVGLLLLLTVLLPVTHATVPQQINYQGYLAGSDGNPVPDGNYEMSFDIYNVSGGGTPLWSEAQTVTVASGVYNVILGQPGNFIDPDILDGDRYLGVTVGDDAEMTSRQKMTATAFSLKAAKADEADTLDGIDSTGLDQSAHVARTDNPHSVTAAQTGAASMSDITWGNLSNIPAGFDDGVDDTGITAETDPTIIDPSIKDGVSWGELSGIPSGFADDVDNTGIIAETDPQVGTNSSNYIPKWNGSALVSGSIFDNGNVGIGTANPTKKLHVSSPSSSWGMVTFENSNPGKNEVSLSFAEGSDVVSNDIWLAGVGMWENSGDFMIGRPGASSKFMIDNNGDVGIGTTDPDARLEVAGNLKVSGTGNGVVFPDGTVQTTAAAPTWHQKLPAADRFELVMDNQAVLDKETGLVWAKDANIDGTKTWQTAINYCANLNISDRKGWRLPEREELASLLDMSVSGSPKLPAGHPFINVQSLYYWSSTTYASATDGAWYVTMSTGHVNYGGKASSLYVWPVRSDN